MTADPSSLASQAEPDLASRHDSGDDRATVRERRLFTAAVAGDRAALESLWATHRRWVAVVLLAHKPAAVDLDDLLQDVAVRFVDRIADVRGAASLRPWLRTVAINVARAVGRSGRVRATAPLDGDCGDPRRESRSDGCRGEALDDARRLLSLAVSLPEPYREPLLLRSLRDMTTRQIALLLDLPETTVETRVSRARRMLRERSIERPTTSSEARARTT